MMCVSLMGVGGGCVCVTLSDGPLAYSIDLYSGQELILETDPYGTFLSALASSIIDLAVTPLKTTVGIIIMHQGGPSSRAAVCWLLRPY